MPIASAVSRKELEEFVGAYRHIRDEHGRARPDGHTRRRLKQKVERLFVADELRSTRPGFKFKLDGTEFRETFRVSHAAGAVLRLLVDQGARPLARLRRELLLEGLIDRNLGLTPRGRRSLG